MIINYQNYKKYKYLNIFFAVLTRLSQKIFKKFLTIRWVLHF